jgi:hypothetical protein
MMHEPGRPCMMGNLPSPLHRRKSLVLVSVSENLHWQGNGTCSFVRLIRIVCTAERERGTSTY